MSPFAFVADVLLYDRLMLPTPSPDDVDRWIRSGWDPDRQLSLVEALGDRCQTVVWDAERRARWQGAFAAAIATAQETKPDAFKYTRMQLTEDLPRRVTGVDAVAAYTEVAALREDVELQELESPAVGPGLTSAVFAADFIVPAEVLTRPRSVGQELEVLSAALELSSTKSYQRNRRSYWRMVKEFSSGLVTDADALTDAVEEMRDQVEEQNELIRERSIDLAVRIGFLATTVTLGLISAPTLPVVAAGGALLAVGQFTWSELQGRRQTPASEESRVIALFSQLDRDIRDEYFKKTA